MEYKVFLKKDDLFKEEQTILWKNNLNILSGNRFDWFYHKNPYAKPITVLAQSEDNNLVGNCSLYARELVFFASEIRIGIASDFAINKAHRVYGPALKMQRLLVEEGVKRGFDFFFAFPNNNSRALFQRVGYKKLGRMNSGIKILKSNRWISRKIKNPLLSFTLSTLINVFLWLIDYGFFLLDGLTYNADSGYIGDKEYNGLWKRAQKKYRIIGKKDAKYLKWRYTDNPSKEYQFFNVFDKKHELKGFVVYTLKDKQVILEELFAESPTLKLDFLLSKFIHYIRKQNAEQIVFGFLGGQSVLKQFKKKLFFIKSINRFCLIFPPKTGSIDLAQLFNVSNWFLFESEMDL